MASINNSGERYSNVRTRFSELNRDWGTQISLLGAIILLSIVFSIASPYFFTIKNLVNVGHYMSIMGMLAAGCTVALIIGALDVSQYSNLALTGVFCIMLDRAGVPVGVIFLFALVVGSLFGALNGFIVTVLKINPIIGTIASGMIMRGITYMITEGKSLSVTPERSDIYYALGRGTFLGIPITLIIMLVVYLIIFIILKYTPFGRQIFAVGGNSEAAYLAGINLKKTRFGALILAGATAGIGGFFLLAQIGAMQPNTGEASLMDVIAAVLLGGLSLSGGKGKLTGTILGVIILVIIQNGMTLLGIQAFWQMMVRGGIVIVAVFIDVLRGGGYK
jgi:ribose transport system permease protein